MASESHQPGPPGPRDRRDEERGPAPAHERYPGPGPSSSSNAPHSQSRGRADFSSSKLFIGQIPVACSEDDLHQLFAPYGELHEVVIFRSKSGNEKAGYGFVIFTRREDAEAAIFALHFKAQMPKGTTLLQVKLADSDSSSSSEPKLFVGNLSMEVQDSDLAHIFSPFGEITEIVILRHPDGNPKGSGFVRFRSMDAAHSAIDALNNRQELHGRTLSISLAETPRDRQQRKRAPLMGGRAQHSSPFDHGPSYNRNPPPYHQQQPSYGGPPPYYGPPSSHMPYAPPNFDSVIQGIESQIAGGGQAMRGPHHDPYQPQYGAPPPPPYHAPPPPYQPGPPSGHYMPPPPMSSVPQQDSLLSMMMPRPGVPSHGNYHMDNNMRSALGSKQEGPKDSNLFILHFPKEWRNEDLYTAFSPYGRIVSANIFLDKETGESKCFGFVSYDNPHSAASAVGSMGGQQVGSKRIKVELKRQ